ncbi:MAG: FAD-dependent oxidoreductase [Coriobacteriia bacterium]|nr:FAD-dependent oxidoreductase [Coriobacteriia bacterium]MBS5478989.1 FAD-dependent oxidoreductase [Coriobacteriia bacterium]
MAELTRRTFVGTGALGLAAVAAGSMAMTAQAAESSAAKDVADAYDVIVVGAGGSGLCAALEACDAGASVLVLEKGTVTGGTTSVSQGLIGGYDTYIQKEQGVELTYQEMYDNLAANASYRLDPELMGITIEQSGPSIDWLHERADVPFQPEAVVGYGPLTMMHIVDGAGAALTDALTKAVEASGIPILLETTVTSIVMEDGAVAGVVAKGADGVEKTYSCAGLVIATGGYSMNVDLAARFTPEVAGTMGIGHPCATGDGIIMAANAGACTSHTDSMMCVLKDYTIMTEGTPTSAAADVHGFTSLPNMIMVGSAGTRFYNEGAKGYMSQDLNRPVFDQMHKDGLGYVWMVSDKAAIDATEGKTKRGEDREYATGDTPEALAEAMGVDAAGLAATIEAYNAAVDTGFDAEFGRVPTQKLEPPFFALPVTPCSIITYGGILRDKDSQVLRADGEKIPGMFCCGETSCNSAFMGFTISNAVTWGRIAGAGAAKAAGK